MELSIDDVRKLAELARLSLTDAELADYQRTLGEILSHVQRVQGYVADKAPVVYQRVVTDRAELRSDEPTPGLDAAARATFLDSGRTNSAGTLVVPGVFGDRS